MEWRKEIELTAVIQVLARSSLWAWTISAVNSFYSDSCQGIQTDTETDLSTPHLFALRHSFWPEICFTGHWSSKALSFDLWSFVCNWSLTPTQEEHLALGHGGQMPKGQFCMSCSPQLLWKWWQVFMFRVSLTFQQTWQSEFRHLRHFLMMTESLHLASWEISLRLGNVLDMFVS